MSLSGYRGPKGEHVPAAVSPGYTNHRNWASVRDTAQLPSSGLAMLEYPSSSNRYSEQPMFYFSSVRHEACLEEVPRYRISLQITRSRAETGNAIPGGSTLVTHSRQIVPAKHR